MLGSFLFLEYEKTDYEHERDAFQVAKYIVSSTSGVNLISPESKYFKTAEIFSKWPNIPDPDENGNLILETKKISSENFDSVEEFIQKSKDYGLTHLIMDGKPERAKYLNEIYFNEKQYVFLNKVYDSAELGLSYHVKIYKIDYDLFEKSEI